jgi:hypothetical protein
MVLLAPLAVLALYRRGMPRLYMGSIAMALYPDNNQTARIAAIRYEMVLISHILDGNNEKKRLAIVDGNILLFLAFYLFQLIINYFFIAGIVETGHAPSLQRT